VRSIRLVGVTISLAFEVAFRAVVERFPVLRFFPLAAGRGLGLEIAFKIGREVKFCIATTGLEAVSISEASGLLVADFFHPARVILDGRKRNPL
jgi:hypothetical protein